jgi:hypothetical protein
VRRLLRPSAARRRAPPSGMFIGKGENDVDRAIAEFDDFFTAAAVGRYVEAPHQARRRGARLTPVAWRRGTLSSGCFDGCSPRTTARAAPPGRQIKHAERGIFGGAAIFPGLGVLPRGFPHLCVFGRALGHQVATSGVTAALALGAKSLSRLYWTAPSVPQRTDTGSILTHPGTFFRPGDGMDASHPLIDCEGREDG